MFLNSKQERAIEFCMTILESRGLEVNYPNFTLNPGKVNISAIRWAASDIEGNLKAHILLTKWDKKFKLIVWLPKTKADEDLSAIDPYVVLDENKTHLILPYGQGQLSLGKISPDMFMLVEEMRAYLGY